MKNIRRCGICNIRVHRESYAKHLRRKKQLENIRQDEKVIAEKLFEEEQTPLKKNFKKYVTPKTLKQMARNEFESDDKELGEELAKKRLFHIVLQVKI